MPGSLLYMSPAHLTLSNGDFFRCYYSTGPQALGAKGPKSRGLWPLVQRAKGPLALYFNVNKGLRALGI